MEKQHWLVKLYHKSKSDFILVGLLLVIGYLSVLVHGLQGEIKQYQKNEIKNNEFLQNWIDRHDNLQNKKDGKENL